MGDAQSPVLETVFIAGRATARRLQKSRVVVIDGPDRGRSFEFERPRCTIGRSSVCDLVLTDRAASATHCELEAVESGWLLRDLGSTNGCYVGDVRIREAILPLGARVRVGTSTLQIEAGRGSVEIPLSAADRFHDLVGRSVPMRQVFAQLEKVAPLDVTVLVHGETGTGKELVARALHRASKRATGPLVVQDCSALPRDLVESVLFGHERGAFTGATERRAGSFEQAHGGTLFLDEVGELPLDLQPKLLRALENREVRRVGGDRVVPTDVRVIAATNRDLRAMVGAGTFREDLYYRLGVVTVELPPLRARREDIPLVAQALLEQFVRRHPEVGTRTLSEPALEKLSSLPWPGNVRELRNVIERAASLCEGTEITVDDLLPAGVARAVAVPGASLGARTVDTVIASAAVGVHPEAPERPSVRPGEVPDELAALPFKDAKARVLEAFEPAYLRALLVKHNDNITRSAAAAGLTRYHLRELCKRYGLRSTDNDPE
jgi:transcriptional regulator with GAF, ATPase, and Fis domain